MRCTATITAIANHNAGSRKITVQLAGTYLGIVGEPQDYLTFIVPPTAKEEDGPEFEEASDANDTCFLTAGAERRRPSQEADLSGGWEKRD